MHVKEICTVCCGEMKAHQARTDLHGIAYHTACAAVVRAIEEEEPNTVESP